MDQTHARRIKGEWWVWDVEELWVLAKDLTPGTIAVKKLVDLDENIWFHGDDEPTLRRVVKHCKRILDADLSYPIILCPKGEIMDGCHRVAKCLLEGIETIAYVQFEQLPEPTEITDECP